MFLCRQISLKQTRNSEIEKKIHITKKVNRKHMEMIPLSFKVCKRSLSVFPFSFSFPFFATVRLHFVFSMEMKSM